MGGFVCVTLKQKYIKTKSKRRVFLCILFCFLEKHPSRKIQEDSFYGVFFATWKKNPLEIQENIFYILLIGCFKWFLFCYLLHSSQLPLFLRLRNFENQVGRDALGEDQDDQDVDQDDRNDRDDRTDRDDRNDRDVRNDCDDYDDD